jgi:ribosomal subunit interface protein
MKITYAGRHISLIPSQVSELEDAFAKVRNLLDTKKGEAEARVTLKHEHNSNEVEVKVTWRHHELAAESEHTDLFTAIHAAVGKIESQALKLRAKARDLKRVPVQ